MKKLEAWLKSLLKQGYEQVMIQDVLERISYIRFEAKSKQ